MTELIEYAEIDYANWPPLLIVFVGVPGSGKTYFATRLAAKRRMVTLNSDAMRLAIWGSREAVRRARPTPEDRERNNMMTFGAMEYLAKQALQVGVSCLYDANANQRTVRRKTANLAIAHNAVPIVVRIRTRDELALERMQTREDTEDRLQFGAEKASQVLKNFTAAIEEPASDESIVEISGEVPFEEQYIDFCQAVDAIVNKHE